MRAGLTGLGIVFLLTLAASMAFGPPRGADVNLQEAKEPGEPLAQLGVAPSNDKSEPVKQPGARTLPAPEPAPATESPVTGAPDADPFVEGDRPVAV